MEDFELHGISKIPGVISESLLEISFCPFSKDIFYCFSTRPNFKCLNFFYEIYGIWLIHLIKVLVIERPAFLESITRSDMP